MKKTAILLLTLSILASCKQEKKVEAIEEIITEESSEIQPINDDVLESAVIYEANIRQYSEEGTFDAFTKDIPQLKDLGVKIIWLMPINPISETKRKATGGDFADLIEDETERAKMLGSYYAVSDYKAVNPEFGNIEDFRELVKTAHDNGIYVILDWVPNHTGWDHVWIKEHPEYYVKNDKGEITDPLNPDGTSKGWGDVAQLDYTNMDMQNEMIQDMMYWVKEEKVDGFRCDHIEPTPVDFWKRAIAELRAERAVFMLGENDDPKFMQGSDLFEMEYGWKFHHLMKDIVKGEKPVNEFYNLMDYINTAYENDDIIMNFVTNHDENSWNGIVTDRYKEASESVLALSYAIPGMPLIYSGQEYDLAHQLKFFEKDQIPKEKGKVWPVLEKLGELKNTNPALHGGKQKADYEPLDLKNEHVLSFKRHKGNDEVIYLGNFSNKEQTISISEKGSYNEYMTGKKLELSNEPVTLKPWEYMILVN
ncbi:alpha-amylase family glycosyl hydrolase [Hanstruepera ponticola]|uniref:alpha-amylase family glycosyl hydrolase n=1 Tax=Hanstruepera ponticola TaxID=2042995 RepID=UPI000CF16BF5|nr:alpha-amylase family glycosyl hydrolase [Hanstruepera ponticola]